MAFIGAMQSRPASAASTGSTQDVWYDFWVQSDGASADPKETTGKAMAIGGWVRIRRTGYGHVA